MRYCTQQIRTGRRANRYHNEHHDFPNIPGSRLAQVKAIAPESPLQEAESDAHAREASVSPSAIWYMDWCWYTKWSGSLIFNTYDWPDHDCGTRRGVMQHIDVASVTP